MVGLNCHRDFTVSHIFLIKKLLEEVVVDFGGPEGSLRENLGQIVGKLQENLRKRRKAWRMFQGSVSVLWASSLIHTLDSIHGSFLPGFVESFFPAGLSYRKTGGKNLRTPRETLSKTEGKTLGKIGKSQEKFGGFLEECKKPTRNSEEEDYFMLEETEFGKTWCQGQNLMSHDENLAQNQSRQRTYCKKNRTWRDVTEI